MAHGHKTDQLIIAHVIIIIEKKQCNELIQTWNLKGLNCQMNAKTLCNIHLEVTLSSVVGGGVEILYA